MTRFGVDPAGILRASFISFDSIINLIEALSRSRDETIGLAKLFCFGNTDTLVLEFKNEMRIGKPEKRTSSRIAENSPGKRLTPSAMKTA
jgi:hypothetical protein